MKNSIAVFQPYRFAEKIFGLKIVLSSCFILFVILCICFSSLKAEPVSSHKRPHESAKANSKSSPKIGSSFKLVESRSSLNDGWRPQASFFHKHAEGWHWYESLRNDKIEEEKESSSSRSSPSHSQTPTEKIEAQRKELETKLHTAILEPSRENIITYILVQKALMDQSQRFSESWQRVVMTTPALDETLEHPVDQNARHVYYGEKNKELTSRIKALAQDYGLFFFFRKNCPYCHHFAPVVKHFAEKHSWSVLAISLDGGVLPEFPHARRNNGIAERLRVSHVPALIALHPQSGQMIPLAYGLVSESEIEERVDLLTRMLKPEGDKK
ncbi:MAG: type-F conjugative transfer system pilin assembly protein TraF [Alphaproteobacteria bacterium]|nr:type-F conjugative transfer system pilin assembly protein TraF [Alphaproteobacteria bacterium]MBP9776716.1 type-F conjugative transfer system pilin assembly protein TraF [Alphaproteobacteria bacterium]